MDIKPNFFMNAAKPAQVTLPVIQFMNDPQFRASYGKWLYDNFNELTAEYKVNGRFLTLQEINEPLD